MVCEEIVVASISILSRHAPGKSTINFSQCSGQDCNLSPDELKSETLQRCWQVLSPTRKETSYSDRRFWVSCILFIIIIGGILVLFICITRLASNEMFSPSNKIHREVGRAKDLSAPRQSFWHLSRYHIMHENLKPAQNFHYFRSKM
jgi:hypothetical protein